MNIAYFDCFAGAGGDMIVAAMLDAGVDRKDLLEKLNSLGLGPIHYQIETVKRRGILATYFEPRASATPSLDKECHHHHRLDHEQRDSDSPRHEDRPDHDPISPSHSHRSLADILRLIRQALLPASIRDNAIAVFEQLGRVEAGIHNKSLDEIHFHEVGAMDSIIDIVGACICFDALKIDKVVCSSLAVGSGTISCAHGILPVPAPATVELLRQAKAPLCSGPGDFELLTPTAAALLTHFASSYGPLPSLIPDRIGYGAGRRDADDFPNVLRVILGHPETESYDTDSVGLLECNIDDAPAEQIGQAMETILKAGALDVFSSPIQMKHSRPGIVFSVLCDPLRISKFEGLIFRLGLTLGLRKQILQRSILPREFKTVDTSFGPIRIKIGIYNGQCVFLKPEYADCVMAADRFKVSWVQVWQETLRKTQGGTANGSD